MKWDYHPPSDICVAVWVSGDYTISDHEGRFCVSCRPTGQHVPLGVGDSLQAAKLLAENHAEKLHQQS